MFCMFVGEKIANSCTLVENQLKTAMVFSSKPVRLPADYASLNLNYPYLHIFIDLEEEKSDELNTKNDYS